MKKSFSIPLSLLTLSAVGLWGYTFYGEMTHALQTREPSLLMQDKAVSDVYGFEERFFEFKIGPHSDTSPDTPQPGGQTDFVHSGAQPVPVQPVSAKRALLTQQAIQARYTPAFTQLQRDLDSRITELKQAAWVDHYNFKQKGSPSIPEIVIKYTTVGQKLERASDQAFYRILGQMKRDLRAAGLSMDAADRAEREYKALIQRKKTELIRKGKAKL